MKRKITIQLKAAFLLLIFGLNTIVGFACSLGLNMNFNTPHHKEKETTPVIHIHANGKKHVHTKATAKPAVHIHADGKKHVHTKATTKPAVHIHADGKKHEHKSEPVKQHHKEKETPKKDKDGCCNDDVLKFQNLDKNLNQNTKTVIDAPALVSMLSTFLIIELFKTSATPQLAAIRYLFPPPPNIRIVIHRFQV